MLRGIKTLSHKQMLSRVSADVELNMKTVWKMKILVFISNFCLCNNCFIIYSKMVLSFTEIFHNFASMLSNSSTEDFFYVERFTHLPQKIFQESSDLKTFLISASQCRFQSICSSCIQNM